MSDSEPEPCRELSVADMRRVIASIWDVLECPICYQELHAPIYQCNNGHPVCASCRPRLRACPVCKSWMYHVRALTLEKIVREMPRPCRYLSGGCTERVSAGARAKHERFCPRRPARCVEALVACSWKGPLSEARAHLWSNHELEGRLHRAMHGRFSFSLGCVGQEKFLEDTAESVLFRCLIRAERGKLHFLCHALVAADRAESYVFRVLVTNRCSDRRLSYEGPVPSVFHSVSKTIEASQGLRVGRDWLLKACSCRAGQSCFDTTWQLNRRIELAKAEHDLRVILAGAYPEPHAGSHDCAASVTPPAGRMEARTFTPSRGSGWRAGSQQTRRQGQETPGSSAGDAPGAATPERRAETDAATPADAPGRDVSASGASPALRISDSFVTLVREAVASATEEVNRRVLNSPERGSDEPANAAAEESGASAASTEQRTTVSTITPAEESTASGAGATGEACDSTDTPVEPAGASEKSPKQERDVPANTAAETSGAASAPSPACATGASVSTPDRKAGVPAKGPASTPIQMENDTSVGTPERRTDLASDVSGGGPTISLTTPGGSTRVLRSGGSLVSAACYAAAVARLHSAIVRRQTDGSRDTEDATAQQGTTANCLSDDNTGTVATSPAVASKGTTGPDTVTSPTSVCLETCLQKTANAPSAMHETSAVAETTADALTTPP